MNIIKFTSLSNKESDIKDQACTWVVKLDNGMLTPEEKAELLEWVNASPRHKSALERVAATWINLDKLSDVLEQQSSEEMLQTVKSKSVRFSLGNVRAYSYAFALVAVVVFTGAFITTNFIESTSIEEYGTAIGEVKSVVLRDGSNVSLNTNTAMSVAYKRNVRFIDMKAGEAYFEVAHDLNKPFLVRVGKHIVRAVGTAFYITAIDDSLDVIVTDGRVEVSAFEASSNALEESRFVLPENDVASVALDQGQHGVFSDILGNLELLQEIQPEILQKNLSWRDGMLIFDNDTLAQVVAEISRYTAQRIIISDSEIEDLRFNGYFQVGDVSAILATLENNIGVQVNRVSDDLIYLSLKE